MAQVLYHITYPAVYGSSTAFFTIRISNMQSPRRMPYNPPPFDNTKAGVNCIYTLNRGLSVAPSLIVVRNVLDSRPTKNKALINAKQ